MRTRLFSAATSPKMSNSERPAFNPAPAFRKTQHPDEDWKLGDGLRTKSELGARWKEDEKSGWKTMNLDEMEKPCVVYFYNNFFIPDVLLNELLAE